MKINKELLVPSINIILILGMIALAISCTTQRDVMIGNYYNQSNYCPAYN